MINNIVREQLDTLCKDYDLQWIDNTTCLFEKKKVVSPDSIIVGQQYNIQVFDYIVNEPPNFTLSTNWNGGRKIMSTNLLIYIKEFRGKMLCVDAKDDLGNYYQGIWLPRASIKSIQ